jgi:hypothetical protein
MAYARDYDANGVNHVSIPDFQFSDGAKLDIKVAYRSINQSAKKAVLVFMVLAHLIHSLTMPDPNVFWWTHIIHPLLHRAQR